MINHYVYLGDDKTKLDYIGSYKGIPIYLTENRKLFIVEHSELYSREIIYIQTDTLEKVIKEINRL